MNALQSTKHFTIDLDKQQISTTGATYSALSIICKESFFGLLGHVYYLETAAKKGRRIFRLYGGEVIHTFRVGERAGDDATTKNGIARELNQEIGGFGSPNDPKKFEDGHFEDSTSVLRTSSEGGKLYAVDIFKLKKEVADHISLKKIKSFQSGERRKLRELTLSLEKERDTGKAEQIRREIAAQKIVIEELGGPPIRMRRLARCWFQLRWAMPWPFPWRIRPNWSQYSPLAAYALMTDARFRDGIAD